MIELGDESKRWIREQSPAIVIACVVLTASWFILKDQRHIIREQNESHERQMQMMADSYERLYHIFVKLDKRVEIIGVDLELINGRGKRAYQRLKQIEIITADEANL